MSSWGCKTLLQTERKPLVPCTAFIPLALFAWSHVVAQKYLILLNPSHLPSLPPFLHACMFAFFFPLFFYFLFFLVCVNLNLEAVTCWLGRAQVVFILPIETVTVINGPTVWGSAKTSLFDDIYSNSAELWDHCNSGSAAGWNWAGCGQCGRQSCSAVPEGKGRETHHWPYSGEKGGEGKVPAAWCCGFPEHSLSEDGVCSAAGLGQEESRVGYRALRLLWAGSKLQLMDWVMFRGPGMSINCLSSKISITKIHNRAMTTWFRLVQKCQVRAKLEPEEMHCDSQSGLSPPRHIPSMEPFKYLKPALSLPA